MTNFDDPKYNVYSSNYGIETLNDDIFKKGGTETITTGDGVYEKMYFDKRTKTYKPLPLQEVTIRPDNAPDRNPNSAASIRESYRNIILGLRNQGYNNWADAVEHVNQHGGGVGNAVAWYQGSVARHNDLLKAQRHANTVSEKKEYQPLAKGLALLMLGAGAGGALMTGGGLAGGTTVGGSAVGGTTAGGTASYFGTSLLPGFESSIVMGPGGSAMLTPAATTLGLESLVLPAGGITALALDHQYRRNDTPSGNQQRGYQRGRNRRQNKQQNINNDVESRLSELERKMSQPQNNNNNDPWWWEHRGKLLFGLGAGATWWLMNKQNQQPSDSVEQKKQEQIINSDLDSIENIELIRTIDPTGSVNNLNNDEDDLESIILFNPNDTLSKGW